MNGDASLVGLRNVRKTFGTFVALDDVDLDVRRGEFFSVLGPSGCGKSTMLRLVAGLEWADSGTLTIDGRNMDAVPAYRRPCNMVFQNYAIFPHLSVHDNVAYGLRGSGMSRAEQHERVMQQLAVVRLTGMEARRPEQLSGGQRQRVALARALARQPEVLLLDEPLGALDKTLREQMQHELRELQRLLGITFILVTHDQEEALSMSDRIAVMSEGRILQVATPLDIYERPGCKRVARFIGDINFISAVTENLDGDRSASVRVTGFGRIEFDECLPAEQAGMPHQVAIRPEKLTLSGERSSAAICVPGTVTGSSYWGDQSQFQVAIDDCDLQLTVAAHNARGPHGAQPARGERVWLSAERSAFIRFRE